ncbi:MAG: diheme cytochrome c [Thiobacillaceae bacterium]|nr:diheme cytochrome c [Thiobacillaceae bacterium]
MGINFRNLGILLATLIGSSFWLGYSWGSGSDAYFPPVSDRLTAEECGACHMAYPAGLLPARSWQRMMRELEDHFGEDASLPPADAAAITRYLVENAADNPRASHLIRRIASGIPANASPQRFTETRHFGFLHDEVPARVWNRAKIASKANCVACHTRAESGSFIEREIKIPKE